MLGMSRNTVSYLLASVNVLHKNVGATAKAAMVGCVPSEKGLKQRCLI